MADTSPKSPASPARATSPPTASSPTGATSPPATSNPVSPGSGPGSPPANTGVLEADDQYDDDADSAVSVHTEMSDTTSFASSIFKFRQENGRSYHAYKATESAYFLPNDETENERLDLQHNILLLIQDNKLFICPAGKEKPLKRVLDAGTGTGIWAMEFADEHPETAVVGVDLSPIQPNLVAPNVEFYVDDLEAEWTYVKPFDFIYVRMMVGSIRDWPKLFRQAYQHLAPGGYIEICDSVSPVRSDDNTLTDDNPMLKWNKLMLEAAAKLGAPLDSGLHYQQQLIDAGFKDVVKVEYKMPMNSWPRDFKHKEAGEWNYANLLQGIQAMTLMLFTNVLGWSSVEVEVFLVAVRKAFKDTRVHAYWPIYVVYGQKPE